MAKFLLNKKQWLMAFQASAWKVAVVLFLVAWWSNVQTQGSTLRNLITLQQTMQPTMSYYDTNQDAAAIMAVSYTAGNVACATGLTPVPQLYNWPGTKKSSSHASTDAISLNSWKGATFCYTLAPAGTTIPLTTQAPICTPGNLCTTGTCQTGYVQCDTCNCYLGTTCPVTGFSVASVAPTDTTYVACTPDTTAAAEDAGNADATTTATAATTANVAIVWPAGVTPAVSYTAYCQSTAWSATVSQQPLVAISADAFGTSCVSPTAHAAGTSYQYLNTVSTGCNSFGVDDFSSQADVMLQSDFFVTDIQNSAVMTSTRLFSDYTTTLTGNMVLQGRYRVATDCSQECREFRFGTAGASLLTSFSTNFKSLVWLMKVAFWSSVVTLVFGLYVKFGVKREDRTQNHYFYLAMWCCAVVFVTLVLLCNLWLALDPWGSSHGYVDYQHTWAKWVKMNCVTDANWSQVISSFYHTTSLTNFTWWVKFWTVVTSLLFVWLVFCVYWVTQRLNKRRQYNEIDHNDVELGY